MYILNAILCYFSMFNQSWFNESSSNAVIRLNNKSIAVLLPEIEFPNDIGIFIF